MPAMCPIKSAITAAVGGENWLKHTDTHTLTNIPTYRQTTCTVIFQWKHPYRQCAAKAYCDSFIIGKLI